MGSYRLWHHEHHLEARNGGVWMTDVFSYTPPLGFLGRMANTLLIRKKLKAIFDYRVALEKYFPSAHA